jgi:pimeloyl-ACP methyl ester carboxylesterase
MPLIQTPVAEIEYLENGDPGGRPVVLLHGFPDIPATWDEVISVLPPGLRIVRPYLRGHGGSRVRPASWEEAGGAQVAALATDVLDLLDVLGLGQVLLVGHDWGARAAYAAAVLAPERVTGLVAMATAYGPMRHLNAAERFTEAERAWYRYWLCTDTGAQTFALHPAAFIRRCWAEWSPAFYLPEDQTQAIIRATRNEQFTEAVVHYYRHGTGAAPGRPRYAEAQARLDEWPRIDAPVSFLYGVDDGCEIAAAGRGNAAMFTQAYDCSELPGAGHFLPRERPDAVAAAISLRLQQPAGLPVDLPTPPPSPGDTLVVVRVLVCLRRGIRVPRGARIRLTVRRVRCDLRGVGVHWDRRSPARRPVPRVFAAAASPGLPLGSAAALGCLAGAPQYRGHHQQRGQRHSQRDEVGGREAAQGHESASEPDHQDRDHGQGPALQEQPQRERRRGRGHLGLRDDGFRGPALRQPLAHPHDDGQAAGLVRDQQ